MRIGMFCEAPIGANSAVLETMQMPDDIRAKL